MSLVIERPGIFTTVQDLGRWGYQSRGVTTSGAMDPFSLRIGNAMLGNDQNDAALEVLLPGLEITIAEPRCIVLTGADLKMRIDGAPADAWRVYFVYAGSRIALTGLAGDGCRGYLAFSGGIDVPPVMGSRSTYARAQLGGFHGRRLKEGDILPLCPPQNLWRRSAGFACPETIRPGRSRDEAICAMDGPQVSAFTTSGIETFYGETYSVTNEVDRMGFRLDGPEIERRKSADILSDAVVYGSVQVPGHGRPIVMMADHQTTGGYTKIAVVSAWSAAVLSQRMPGEPVRFNRVTEDHAVAQLAKFEENMRTLQEMRATYRSRG